MKKKPDSAPSMLERYPPSYQHAVRELLEDLRSGQTSPPTTSPSDSSSFSRELASKMKPYFDKAQRCYLRKRYLELVDQLEKVIREKGLDVLLPFIREDLNHPRCIREEFFDKKGDFIGVGPKKDMPVCEEMAPGKGGRRTLYDEETEQLIAKELKKGTPYIKIAWILSGIAGLVPDSWKINYGVSTWKQVIENRRALNTMKKSFSYRKHSKITL